MKTLFILFAYICDAQGAWDATTRHFNHAVAVVVEIPVDTGHDIQSLLVKYLYI